MPVEMTVTDKKIIVLDTKTRKGYIILSMNDDALECRNMDDEDETISIPLTSLGFRYKLSHRDDAVG